MQVCTPLRQSSGKNVVCRMHTHLNKLKAHVRKSHAHIRTQPHISAAVFYQARSQHTKKKPSPAPRNGRTLGGNIIIFSAYLGMCACVCNPLKAQALRCACECDFRCRSRFINS